MLNILGSCTPPKTTLAKVLDGSLSGYSVEPVLYSVNGTDMTGEIQHIRLSAKDGEYVECELSYKNSGSVHYWMFKTDGTKQKDKAFSGRLHDISMEADDWGYYDDKASGSFEYDPETGTETVNITFHLHKSEYRYTIRWRGIQ